MLIWRFSAHLKTSRYICFKLFTLKTAFVSCFIIKFQPGNIMSSLKFQHCTLKHLYLTINNFRTMIKSLSNSYPTIILQYFKNYLPINKYYPTIIRRLSNILPIIIQQLSNIYPKII